MDVGAGVFLDFIHLGVGVGLPVWVDKALLFPTPPLSQPCKSSPWGSRREEAPGCVTLGWCLALSGSEFLGNLAQRLKASKAQPAPQEGARAQRDTHQDKGNCDEQEAQDEESHGIVGGIHPGDPAFPLPPAAGSPFLTHPGSWRPLQAHALKEEKKRDIHRMQELERSFSELKHQIAEPPSPVDPAGTSQVEQLQDEAKHLRKEVESLEGKLQFQMENNQALSLLSKEQKERLQEQEERLREQQERLQKQEERRLREEERLCEQKERLREKQKRLGEQGERLWKQEERLRKEEERLQKQEERLWEKEERLRKQEKKLQMQEERLALSQNHKFNKQLAEPQCSFEDLNNKNKSTLQLEQQVKELQEKLSKECLEAASQQNQQLETQSSLMALPGQGDGGGHLDTEEEGVPRPMPSIPKDLESWEATSGFMDLLREKVDGKQQVVKRELGFIQLSGATDGMREHITVCEIQGAGPNTQHKEEEASRLAQKEEEMKVKLLELQDMVLPVVGDHEGHDKFLPAAQNPLDKPAPGAPAPQELAAAEEQSDFQYSVEPAPGQAREGSPRDNPTAQKILQLLPVTQDTQEHLGLATKPCVPFFYRAAKNREINIIII
ncbi:golgin subfamily A member 6B-like [Theropithecus gelada]|uniref:golgin subfamily A member 6B-like n=1 Tax=Theropithecus gelada TaxID=9565 RepID=UPI000DC176E0|nr:golgin subfamily A member 6B-like [Theropithecus gelada]